MSRPITIDVDLDTGVAVVYGRLHRRDGLQAMAEIFRRLEAGQLAEAAKAAREDEDENC